MVTYHVNPRAEETKPEVAGLGALPQKFFEMFYEILSAKYAFSWQLGTK